MNQYFEAIGVLACSIVCAILGHVFTVPFLDSAAPMLFGVAVGYLAKQMGVQLPPSSR